MFGDRKQKAGTAFWFLAAGVVVGLTTAMVLGYRTSRRRGAERTSDQWPLEDGVIDALRHDAVLRGRGIDVAGIAPGIIELSGIVETDDEAHHAVEVAQSVQGVRTVVNRLDLAEFEKRRQRGRQRPDGSGSSRWYGMGVGMGRKRQSDVTEPAQRDDHADLVDEALRPDPVEALEDVVEARMETRAAARARKGRELS